MITDNNPTAKRLLWGFVAVGIIGVIAAVLFVIAVCVHIIISGTID